MVQITSKKPIERDFELTERLIEEIEQLQNGEIDYSEAGYWLYSYGWDIVKELEK